MTAPHMNLICKKKSNCKEMVSLWEIPNKLPIDCLLFAVIPFTGMHALKHKYFEIDTP